MATPVDWAAGTLALTAAISYLVSADRHISLPQIIWLLGGLGGLYAVVQWGRGRQRLLIAVATLIGLGVGLAVIAPIIVNWQAVQTKTLPVAIYQLFPLLVGNAVHPNVMAAALGLLLPLPLALAIRPAEPTGRIRLLLWAGWLVMLLTIGLTQSRGGYLATAVVICLVLWLSRRRKWAAVVATISALGIIWLTSLNASSASAAASAATNPANWNFRENVWRVGLQMLSDFPFTGVGMGSFNAVADRLYPLIVNNNPGAHNLFLQVALDLGLPGLIAFLAIVLIVLTAAWQAFRRFQQTDPMLAATAVGLLAGLVQTILHGLVDGGVWGTRGSPLLWIVMGLALALYLLDSRPPTAHLSNCP